MALVGGGDNPKWSKNKVILWDDQDVKKVEELNHNSEVKGVRMHPECVIVILDNKVYMYGMSDFQLIDQIDTYQHNGPTIGLA